MESVDESRFEIGELKRAISSIGFKRECSKSQVTPVYKPTSNFIEIIREKKAVHPAGYFSVIGISLAKIQMEQGFIYVFVREFRVLKVISIPKREIELALLVSEREGRCK